MLATKHLLIQKQTSCHKNCDNIQIRVRVGASEASSWTMEVRVTSKLRLGLIRVRMIPKSARGLIVYDSLN